MSHFFDNNQVWLPRDDKISETVGPFGMYDGVICAVMHNPDTKLFDKFVDRDFPPERMMERLLFAASRGLCQQFRVLWSQSKKLSRMENPCHRIAREFYISTFSLIFVIQKGVDPDTENVEGETPWDIAVSSLPEYGDDWAYAKLLTLFLAGVDTTRDPVTHRAKRIRAESKARFPVLQLCQNKLDRRTQKHVQWQSITIIMQEGLQICIGLQSLNLPALVLCEILQAHFCNWPRIPFHCYWNVVTTIKHF